METLKKCFIRIITGAVFLLASETASAGGWEYVMTQAGRNTAILAVANTYNGRVLNPNPQCNGWVAQVVLSASSANGTPMALPKTLSDGWEWEYSPFVFDRKSIGVTPQQFQPGNIVQMRLKNGTPHTAIVKSISSSGITWLEENYVAGTVTNTRFTKFSDFPNEVPSNNYSVYEVH